MFDEMIIKNHFNLKKMYFFMICIINLLCHKNEFMFSSSKRIGGNEENINACHCYVQGKYIIEII